MTRKFTFWTESIHMFVYVISLGLNLYGQTNFFNQPYQSMMVKIIFSIGFRDPESFYKKSSQIVIENNYFGEYQTTGICYGYLLMNLS